MRTKLAAILLAVGCLYAQGDRGTITGTVADPARRGIANAAIEVRNSETGAVYQDGHYGDRQLHDCASCRPVRYEMTVTAPGSRSTSGKISPSRPRRPCDWMWAWRSGRPRNPVTVSAEVSLLKTESGELSHEIQAQHLMTSGC